MERILYGKETWSEWAKEFEECPDCGVKKGELHDSDDDDACEVEECPICHDQLLGCEHGPGLLYIGPYLT